MSEVKETVVHLLRHGEVENPAKILYGRMPGFRLSALGEQMAKAAAQSLAGRDITHVVASPLERAVQTAEPIAAQFGLEISVDDRLIESANFFEGKRVSVGDGALRDPRNWWVLRDPFGPSWGESYQLIAQRMLAALESVREQASGHEAVCVSHQLPIWTLRRFLERKRLWHDPRRRQCGLASLTSFYFEGPALVGIGYSEPAAHLVVQSPRPGDSEGAPQRSEERIERGAGPDSARTAKGA
jgi:broad specificity phosphatase PhoE